MLGVYGRIFKISAKFNSKCFRTGSKLIVRFVTTEYLEHIIKQSFALFWMIVSVNFLFCWLLNTFK